MNIREPLALVAAVVWCAACGSSQDPGPVGPLGALGQSPLWTADCRAHVQVAADELCGVGMMSGVASPSMATRGAEARARQAIAAQLGLVVDQMVEDYQRNVAEGTTVSEAQRLEGDDEALLRSASREIGSATVAGARVIDRWVSPDGRELYLLMKVDVNTAFGSVEAIQAVSDQRRGQIVQGAEDALERMDRRLASP